MKKQSKQQKLNDCYAAYRAVKEDKPVKRQGAKDGSVSTHPVVAVPDLLERDVLKICLRWLKLHNIFANRHDSGAGDIGNAGYASYGIRGAGDIIGLLPTGQHFEIECKRGRGGRLSIGQQQRMQDIRANNGIYLVIHGIEELEHYMKDLLQF